MSQDNIQIGKVIQLTNERSSNFEIAKEKEKTDFDDILDPVDESHVIKVISATAKEKKKRTKKMDLPTPNITQSPQANMKTSLRNHLGYYGSLNYPKNELGRVDWKQMLPKEYLVVNKDYFDRLGKPHPADIEGLKDQELLVLLNGFKWLARVRGYTELNFPTICSSPSHCTIECRIKWIPCEDNDYQVDVSSGVGDATPENTTSFTKFYLGPMAENRAFVRCVRNYLNIPILGKEEIGEIKKEQKPSESQDLVEKLQNLMLEKKISFEHIKTKLISEGLSDAASYTELKQIPTVKIFDLITRLKNVKSSS